MPNSAAVAESRTEGFPSLHLAGGKPCVGGHQACHFKGGPPSCTRLLPKALPRLHAMAVKIPAVWQPNMDLDYERPQEPRIRIICITGLKPVLARLPHSAERQRKRRTVIRTPECLPHVAAATAQRLRQSGATLSRTRDTPEIWPNRGCLRPLPHVPNPNPVANRWWPSIDDPWQ